MSDQDEAAKVLALKANQLAAGNSNEIERCCWMIVHQHIHGIMPVEYDIRDIDEELYLLVLRNAKRI